MVFVKSNDKEEGELKKNVTYIKDVSLLLSFKACQFISTFFSCFFPSNSLLFTFPRNMSISALSFSIHREFFAEVTHRDQIKKDMV